MHEVVPRVVAMAVSTVITNCRIFCQSSFFIVVDSFLVVVYFFHHRVHGVLFFYFSSADDADYTDKF